MGKAHQIDKWNDIETYNVIFEDEFYGFLGKRSHGFQEQKITFSLNYIPKTFDGLKESKNMKFYIPTYQYFIEFPIRIQEATSIDYIGTKMIDGVKSEGVIASWNTVAPQKKLDQYVVWMNAESKRIVKIAYTVRDKYRFVSGVAYFKDYKDYDGIILPSTMPVESNLLKEGYLHKMSIKNFSPNKVSSKSLTPLN